MDRNIEWPWSWEEEAEWKAELEARDDDFLAELIESAFEDGATDSRYVLGPADEEAPEDDILEEYSVTA